MDCDPEVRSFVISCGFERSVKYREDKPCRQEVPGSGCKSQEEGKGYEGDRNH